MKGILRLNQRALIAAALTILVSSALAADLDSFLAGTNRNCVECDLSARDFGGRELKLSNLDHAKLSNANFAAASLFRSTLQHADLSGANLARSNLNLIDAKWAVFIKADLTDALLYEADLSGADFS
ncbi:MAG TPA: pentapeptide repeat-containing protein, partial [Xanthobacteraceae bacterium]